MLKVCKFGGTSMADKKAIEQVAAIINKDEARKFVVVSAPGKRFSGDEKVTDLLYKAYAEKDSLEGEAFGKIRERFVGIVNDLDLDININKYLDEVEEGIKNSKTSDYAASRGEYLSAVIMADYLGKEFVDPAEIIKFNGKGIFDAEKTNELVKNRLGKNSGAVIAGFYGSMPDGTIKTFSRGGSDITGSVIARGANADIYENWTDVNGFMTTDPRIVKNPKHIEILSYEELRELSYMGASVLHPESIFPLKGYNIPINIRNTFEPENSGTMIVNNTDGIQKRLVTGIAGKKGYTIILIKKAMMNNELGFGRKVLEVLENNNVSFEHMPTGIDTMSVVIASSELTRVEEKVISELRQEVEPDTIEVFKKLSLIAIVGHGMSRQIGTAAKIFTALYNAKINIRMIDQGSSEMNVIIGVEETDLENSIRAIYEEFFGRI